MSHEREETMTVAELIELLRQAPPDSVVEADGCDCVEGAVGIEIREHGRSIKGPTVVISREAGASVLVPERLEPKPVVPKRVPNAAFDPLVPIPDPASLTRRAP
jgi:hypothetical protein